MNWYKESKTTDFVNKIKDILKNNSFTRTLSNYYHIMPQEIDSELSIEVCDLHGKFAEGNGKLIRIDKKLLDKNFFDENFHFVIHEFFHWLKRRSEDKFYFNDPEEVQSFVLQMTWDLIHGKNREDVFRKIHPIVKAHFKDEEIFKEIFKEMMTKAINLSEIYKNEGEITI